MSRPLTAPGRLVAGRYLLQSHIGGGGMGAVWLARDELLGRQVAVKQVLVSETDEALADQQRQRALREGRIAARLSHPHAISVYDVAQEGETPWLVMEYLPSRSLAEVVTADGVLRVDQVAQIGAQVADALAATHAAGIVHRDVKPANILIGQGTRIEGLVKITDFGISHAHGDVTLTQTGQLTGTPAFLAPEVAQGAEMGEASDVFSLGATLYTCLEGQPPFGMEDNALAMLHKVAGGSIRPPARAGSLTGPLTRMLAADPAARPTMAEVRDELARLAAGSTGDTTTVLLSRTDLRAPDDRPPARGKGIWLAAALVVAALTLLIGFWALAPDDTDTGTRPGSDDSAFSSSDAPAGLAPTSQAPAPAPEPPAPETPASEAPAPEPPASEAPLSEVPLSDAQQAEDVPAATDTPANALDEQNVRNFLRDYHQRVLENPEQAWELTGPTLRANISRAGYISYWQQFKEVRLKNVQAADGQRTATASMELRYVDGRRETGSHQFTFLVQDGRLILDSDFPVG